MRFWQRTTIDPKEEFPIENLPIETLGSKSQDALALMYTPKEQKENTPVPARSYYVDKRKEDFFRRILPILDGFDNIFRYVEHSNLENSETITNWLNTLDSLYRRLQSALENEGLEAIESVGYPLDLSHHEVIDTREDSTASDNVVVEEVVKGYRFGRRVLRDAKVIVAKKPSS